MKPSTHLPGRAAGLALVASLLTTLTALAGCTLISVGSLVGKRFAPALEKGDKEGLKRASTPRLAGYWEAFTEKEIQAAVGADRPKGKPGGKKRKAPSVGLISFKTEGNTATLVVRQGKERFSFHCVRTPEGWKVDNVVFREKGKTRELSRALQILVAAKTLQRGLEQGSRYLLYNVATPALRDRVFQQIRDDELLALSEVAKPPGRGATGAKDGSGGKIESEETATGAIVRSTGNALPVELRLVEEKGLYLVDDVKIQLGGSWHGIGDIFSYVLPAINLLRWAGTNMRGPEGAGPPSDAQLAVLVARLQGLFSERLWGASLAWLTPADLKLLPWSVIRNALAPKQPGGQGAGAAPPQASQALGPEAITRFERKGERLHIEAKLPGWRLGAEFVLTGASWRLDRAWLDRSGQRVELDVLMSALGPLAKLGATSVRLLPELSRGPARTRAAIEGFIEALRAVSSEDVNRRLWSKFTPALIRSLPLEALPADLGDLLGKALGMPSGEGAGSPPQRPSPGPALTPVTSPSGAAPMGLRLEAIHQTADALRLELAVAGKTLAIHLIRETAGWKLDDVLVPLAGERRSMKSVGALAIPALSLAQAVLASDPEALRRSMTPALQQSLVNPLLRILGQRFGSLMKTLRDGIIPKGPGPARAARGPSGTLDSPELAVGQKADLAPGQPPGRRRGLKAKARRAAGRAAWKAAGHAAAHQRRASRARRAAKASHGAASEVGAKHAAPKISLAAFTLDEAKGRAEIGLAIGPDVSVRIYLARDAEGQWAISDARFPLAGREHMLAQVGPVVAPLLGFGLSLMAADIGGVRRASSSSFNAAAWNKMSAARLKKLVAQLTADASKPKGGKSRHGKAKEPPQPKLLALRIKDEVRWPWAQVELELGGNRVLAALVKERGAWKVHDLEAQLGGMSISVKKLIALGL